jgi:putative transposase
MPAPLSNDMRRRIIEAKGNGDSIQRIAREKGVGTNTIACLLKLYRETGSYEPRPLRNGRKPRLDKETLEKIRKRIEEQPDIALYELKEEFALPVSLPALCKTINRKLGLRRKKNGARGRTTPGGCGPQEETVEETSVKL